MTATSYLQGHHVWFNEKIQAWCLMNSKEPVDAQKLICGHCNLLPTKEGHDGCLGILKDCQFACCGHGCTKKEAYIVIGNGKVFWGEEALKKIEERKQ